MVHIGIELSGGIVAADADWERAFAAAAARPAEILRAGPPGVWWTVVPEQLIQTGE
jgi:hypothetical protein